MNAADLGLYLAQTDIDFPTRFNEWAKCGLPLAQRIELGEILLDSVPKEKRQAHHKLVAQIETRLKTWRQCLPFSTERSAS